MSNKKKICFEVEDNNRLRSENKHISGVVFQYTDTYLIEAEYNCEEINDISVIEFVSQYCLIKDITIRGRDIEQILQEILLSKSKTL